MAHRAAQVWTEYQSHARRLDREHSPADTTPIAARLASFSPTCALVFGAHGDASQDVESALVAVARLRARREWRAPGARTAGEACGAVVAGCAVRMYERGRGHVKSARAH